MKIILKVTNNEEIILKVKSLTSQQVKKRFDKGDNEVLCKSLIQKVLNQNGTLNGYFCEINNDVLTFEFFDKSISNILVNINNEEWFEYIDCWFFEKYLVKDTKKIKITLGTQNNGEISITVKKLSADQVREKMRNYDNSSFLCEYISEFVMDKDGIVDGYWSEISDNTISFKNSDGMFVLNLEDEEWFEYNKFC